MRALRRLLPYFRPYKAQLAAGLALVVLSGGFLSVVPWVLRRAIDDLIARAPIRRIWMLAGAMVGLAVIGGAMRYGMREMLNAVSRRIEYDLRNALFVHLTSLNAS